MNENLYIEKKIEDLCRYCFIEKTDATIEDLLVRNATLQEEVIKLKREHESHSVRLCEVMEQKKKVVNDKEMTDEDKILLTTRLEENNNEVHQLSQHNADMENQLDDANQGIINLIVENNRFTPHFVILNYSNKSTSKKFYSTRSEKIKKGIGKSVG